MKKLSARILSRVFGPSLMLPLVFWVMLSVQTEVFSRLYMVWAFLLFLGLPMIYVLIRFGRRHFTDWDVSKREQRIPLFLFTLFSQLGGLVITWHYGYENFFKYLAGMWVLLLVYLGVTLVYKVSVHVGVVTVLFFVTVKFIGWQYGWLLLLPVIVGWSRLVVKQHSFGQVVLGVLLPISTLYLAYWGFGLI